MTLANIDGIVVESPLLNLAPRRTHAQSKQNMRSEIASDDPSSLEKQKAPLETREIALKMAALGINKLNCWPEKEKNM